LPEITSASAADEKLKKKEFLVSNYYCPLAEYFSLLSALFCE
jgi:hypothetical protein